MANIELQPAQVAPWISDLRFAPFGAEAQGDHQVATALYIWNARLAGALLEVFAHVEVLLRNAVHRQLKQTTSPNALRSWLIDPDVLAADELQRVHETIARIKRSKKAPSEDGVLAGLSMGFWAAIFGRRYEELWRQNLRLAFPHGDGTRGEIAGYVNRMVQLRNRVAHHEALIAQPVPDRHDDALALAGAIDPAAEAWIRTLSRVDDVLARRP